MIKLTYLIPVYNEFKTVAKSINQILNLKLKDKEIIIIDNGSRDGSQNEIKKFKNKKNIKIILRKKNLGYGASIMQGAKIAKGKYLYIHFSDCEYDHHVSLKMLKLATKFNVDAIFGSRLKNKSKLQKIFSVFKNPASIATIILTFLYNFFYKKNFTDVIGSKFYKKNIFKKIIIKEKTKTWSSWDFELKNRLISGSYKIMEVFTDYKPRQNFQDKKPRAYHLLFMMWLIIKYRYNLYITRNANKISI